MSTALARAAGRLLDELAERRAEAGRRHFAEHEEAIAGLCHAIAERFARGGRLLAVGGGPAGRTDARHVAVEFVHPVIVGKRALPALAIVDDLEGRVDLLARPEDVVLAVEATSATAGAVRLARERGCLTVALAPLGAECELAVEAPDPFVAQEVAETTYHLLWELVHVFFEHRGLLEGRDAGPRHDAGASSFLYPFLAEQEVDLAGVLADVRASIRMKVAEIAELRSQALVGERDALVAAAATLRAALEAGGTVLAAGNGGSATDAADLVADLTAEPRGRAAHRAIDLTDDTAILTALANDIGPEATFARQVIAHGRPGDVLVTLSTSGGSQNVLAALAEARRRGLVTIALVGYGGATIAAEGLADHVLVVRSQHIPRIQEAQATACHAMLELLELDAETP